jgi:hypothetical protein
LGGGIHLFEWVEKAASLLSSRSFRCAAPHSGATLVALTEGARYGVPQQGLRLDDVDEMTMALP